MFRPTHFVILFAVVLYANALPAAQSTAIPGRPTRAVEPAGTVDLSKKEPGKADLDTDATEYWGYRYNNLGYNLYDGFRGLNYAQARGIYVPRAYPWPPYVY